MGSLLLVTGPPAAGKSTVARILADRFEPSAVVGGDAFFGFLARGAIPPWLPEANDQNDIVIHAAAAAAGQYASGGYLTVYDGVVYPWFLPAFAAATGLAHLDYLVLLPSLERCVERVRTRRGHGFTDEGATRAMHGDFARADVDRRHLLLDPPDEPHDVADLVAAALRSGALAYHRTLPSDTRVSAATTRECPTSITGFLCCSVARPLDGGTQEGEVQARQHPSRWPQPPQVRCPC